VRHPRSARSILPQNPLRLKPRANRRGPSRGHKPAGVLQRKSRDDPVDAHVHDQRHRMVLLGQPEQRWLLLRHQIFRRDLQLHGGPPTAFRDLRDSLHPFGPDQRRHSRVRNDLSVHIYDYDHDNMLFYLVFHLNADHDYALIAEARPSTYTCATLCIPSGNTDVVSEAMPCNA